MLWLHNTNMDNKEKMNNYHVRPKIKPCLKNTLENKLDKKKSQIDYNSKHLQSDEVSSFNAKVVKVELHHEILNESNDLIENDCTHVKREILNDSEDIEKSSNHIENIVIKAKQPDNSKEVIHQYEFEGLDFPSVKAEPPDGTDAEILACEGNQRSDNLGEELIHSKERVIKTEPKEELCYEIEDNYQFDYLDEKFNCIERTVIKIEPKKELSFKTEPKEEVSYEVKDMKDFSVKVEPEDLHDKEMLHSEEDGTFKLEAGDPEAAGLGVDGGLRGRLTEEETSPQPKGNSKIAHFVHL